MGILFTQFGESSSTGIGALGVDGKALVIQLVTFVLAFLVLKRFAFKPIMRVLDERRETIEGGVKLGEKMKKDQAALEAKIAEELHSARKQADAILAGAHDSARQVVRDAEDKARAKTAGVLAEANARIAQDTARARMQLEKELVGLISDATEVIIGEKIDAKKDAALIDRALKEQRVA
ncbi:MAG: F0F1 ATP synthase subunit B [Candidatus Saccharimonadales bacterium]